MLKSILKMTAVSAIGLNLVACSVSEQRVAGYGAGGAALGALAGTAIGGSTPSAALTGAAVGAIAGTITGAAANQRKQPHVIVQHPPVVQQPSMCTYRGRRGQVYQAPCAQTPQTQAIKLCTYEGRGGVVYQAPCHKR
ncbi:hypothetical protein [Bartonella sp. B17]